MLRRFRSRLCFPRFHPKLQIRIGVYLLLVCVTLLGITFWTHPRVLVRDAIYLARPIWGQPLNQPKNVIPHFYAENLTTAELCRLHGWTARTPEEQPAVFDATIFSTEIDLLEIRLRELWNVVDRFIVIEANLTFTGMEKRLHLAEELSRFEWAEEKLFHFTVGGLVSPLPKGETPFYNEIKMRTYMGNLLASDMFGLKAGDLVIVSDVDEIPSAKTISLLKACKGYRTGLHLQMFTYLYSFDFVMDRDTWRPHVELVELYNGTKYTIPYHHQFASDYILAHAGWHCSFCFRTLDQFIFKMLAYSHTDRVTREDQLDKTNIQDKICKGADIFDMFPEGYTYRELISKMGDLPKTNSAIDIPNFVVQNAERFKYLLPGGCRREN